MSYDIAHMDILTWAAEYDGPLFHALLCDPPYHLTTITDRFGKQGSAPAQFGTDGAFARASRGFMNSTWDGGDIAFRPETWAALGTLLHPGAFGMAFASTRGFHRMAVAIEDAGFILQPTIFCWGFGSGFPKATRIPDDRFDGHRYGGQAMKPATEPLVTFRKPLNENPFCAILSQITVLLEGLVCTLLRAHDAEPITNRLHRDLKVAVDNFVHENAGNWALLERVKIAGDRSASDLAGLTLQSFVVGPAPTPDAMRQLVRTILIGAAGRSSRRDTDTSDAAMVSISESIASSWNWLLDALSNPQSTFTIATIEHLIIDLKISRSLIEQSIHATITPLSNQRGLLSYVQAVAMSLQSVITKLPLLRATIAGETATMSLAEAATDQAADVPRSSLFPILVFQKPYAGRPVDSITRTGAGAINVDGGRIGHDEPLRPMKAQYSEGEFDAFYRQGGRHEDTTELKASGRWPANLILSHAPTCNGTCAPGCPVAALGAQSGESEAKRTQRGTVNIFDELYKRAPLWHGESTERGHDDSGTAARFFFNADYALDRLEQNDPLIYVPKASTTEREAGLADFDPTTVSDGREKSIDNAYQRGETSRRNIHPTVKPISLSVHLAKLLLPPDLYAPRRLLIPFAGVGSEILGAMFAGWEDIQGIELMPEHVEIARARIKWWQTMMRQTRSSDPRAILKTYGMQDKEKPSLTGNWPAGSPFEMFEEE